MKSALSPWTRLEFVIDRVRRGVATQHPKKYQLDEKEVERVSALARIHMEDLKEEFEKAQKIIHKTVDKDDEVDAISEADSE